MNLEEFVSTTLQQIISGVKLAQTATSLPDKHSSESNVVNPSLMYNAENGPKNKYFATIGQNLIHFVEFDVAVTADTMSEAKGGVGLKIAGVGISADGETSAKNSTVSRIKFEVPIIFPQ